jgi:glycosyltransferase involved in cell wall biosynthesis
MIKLVVFTHYTEMYGANQSMIALLKALKKTHLNLNILAVLPNKNTDIQDILQEIGIDTLVHPFPMFMQYRWYSSNKFKALVQFILYQIEALANLFRNKQAVRYFANELRKFRPDIIYSNSSVFHTGFDIAKILKIPHVWHLREFGYADYQLVFPWNLEGVHYKKLMASHHLIAISNSIAEYYSQKVPNLNLSIVYNGILDSERFDQLLATKRSSPFSNSRIFCIVGLIQENKGQAEAIKALYIVCQKYPDAQLWIAGDGYLKPIKELAASLHLENNIRLMGKVNNVFENVFLKADASLMCSKSEAMGRVTIESMAASCPVIGFDSAGTSELIEHNKTGMLYKTDHCELAQHMIFLIENPQKAFEMGRAGASWAKDNFSSETYAAKMYTIFVNITKKNSIN